MNELIKPGRAGEHCRELVEIGDRHHRAPGHENADHPLAEAPGVRPVAHLASAGPEHQRAADVISRCAAAAAGDFQSVTPDAARTRSLTLASGAYERLEAREHPERGGGIHSEACPQRAPSDLELVRQAAAVAHGFNLTDALGRPAIATRTATAPSCGRRA